MTDTDDTSNAKPRGPGARGGTSPHVGFRMDKDLAPRVERIAAAMADAAAQAFVPLPDRSATMNAIVRQGVVALEAHFRIPPPPEGIIPRLGFSGTTDPAYEARLAEMSAIQHEAPKAPPAAAHVPSGSAAGKATAKHVKGSKASKSAKGRG